MRVDLSTAASLINSGNVIAVPTETVYGLAASIKDQEAVQNIFELKGRPLVNPLIIHVADLETVYSYAITIPPQFEELAAVFWPGPLTMILPINPALVPSIVRAGLPTAAFRIPSMPVTRELLKLTGPLVMPSANKSGKPSSTCIEHVENDFGKKFPVLEGLKSEQGVESTILIYEEGVWHIARLGALSQEQLTNVLGYSPAIISNQSHSIVPVCPGQLFRHYAPRARLVLREESIPSEEIACIIGFKERDYPFNKPVLILGSLESPEEVAQNLYAILRQLDLDQIESAWIDMSFPHTGLWVTIRERLTRAAE